MDTPEFALPNVGGLRVVRRRVGNRVRDLVMDQQGNVLLNIAGTGARPTIQRSNTGPDGRGRLVVRRPGAAPGAGAAPTGPGAGGTPAGPPDPYADYNDYPFIKNYLKGMDDTYSNFQNYLTNTYNPQITAASQALTAQRLAAGGAYNNAIQNYAGSAGNVAAAMTTPQVAGMTGGTVQAPNQNALGAAQSMAATATAARNIDAGARTALGGLEAEKMGQSFLGSAMGYGAGLLNQYGQKRQSERLKMDQWIAEQKAAEKAAKDKQDLEMLKLDQSMINSLIVSGDRAAARAVTQRGQDIQADNAAASREDKYSSNALQNAGWVPLPKGAGRKGLNIRTSSDGVVMYKPKSGSGGGSGGGGSGRTTPISGDTLRSQFEAAWTGTPAKRDQDGFVTTPAKKAAWDRVKDRNKKNDLAIRWVISKRDNFPGLSKSNTGMLRAWLNTIRGLSSGDRDAIISGVTQLL
jgi:hypothetical protein